MSFPNGKQAYSRVPITPLFPGFSMFFAGQRIDRRGACARGCPARAQNPNLRIGFIHGGGQATHEKRETLFKNGDIVLNLLEISRKVRHYSREDRLMVLHRWFVLVVTSAEFIAAGHYVE